MKYDNSTFAEDIELALRQIQTLKDDVMKHYIAPVVAPNIDALDNDPSLKTEDHPDSKLHSAENVEGPPEMYKGVQEASNNGKYVIQQSLYGLEEIEANLILSARMTDAQFNAKLNTLNSKQKEVYVFVKQWCRQLHDHHMNRAKNSRIS